MTKNEFIELVTIQLVGGTPELKAQSKYHPAVIEKHIGTVFNEIVSATEDIDLLDQFCVVKKNVPVLIDTDFDIKYSEIQETLLSTRAGAPVRMVAQMKDQSNQFLYRANHSQAAFRNLPTQYVFTENTFRIEGKRLYYDIIDPNITEVLIKLLASFDDIGENENIIMPGGQDSTAFRMVVEQLRELKATPEQNKNDNNANTE